MLYESDFADSEHEKAWFVRVAINACTDWLRYLSRSKWVSLEMIAKVQAALKYR